MQRFRISAANRRTKAVPPIPYGLMANVDAPFEQNVFDLTQRQRIAEIRHHHEADYLRRAIEITEGFVHHWMATRAYFPAQADLP